MERAEEFDFTLFVEDEELVISARLMTTANITTKRTTWSHLMDYGQMTSLRWKNKMMDKKLIIIGNIKGGGITVHIAMDVKANTTRLSL